MLLKERDADAVELVVNTEQLKRIYVGLFRQLHNCRPEQFDAFDEDDMLLTLQTFLQRRALEAGVDATDHSQWDAFLGIDAPSCEVRFGKRHENSAER